MTRTWAGTSSTLRTGATLLGAFLLLLGGGGACSTPPAEDALLDDDSIASEESALATWDAPACSTDSLTSPAQECDGPWKYTQVATANGPNAYCGSWQCVQYGSCPLWRNGYDVFSSGDVTQTKRITCTERCLKRAANGEPGECTSSCSPVLAANWCSNQAVTRNNTIRSNIDAELIAEGYGSSARAAILNQVVVTSSIDYTHISTTRTNNVKWYITTDVDDYSCVLTSTRPYKKTAPNAACPCAQMNYPTCDYPIGESTTFTNPGAAKPSGTWVKDQVCTTCDQLPFATDGDVQAKLSCLAAALAAPAPSTTTPATFYAAIRARMKLLFEYRGNLMQPAQRSQIEPTYGQSGIAECHAPLPVDEGCFSEGAAAGVHNRLQACQNLDRDGVPLDVLRAELDYCLAGFDGVASMAPGICQDQYRRAVSTTTRNLLKRLMAVMTASTGSLTNVGEALDDIDRWYEHATLAGGEDRTWLRAASSSIVGAFWQRANELVYSLPTAVTGSNVDSVLAQIDAKNFDVEYQVLTAAFATGATLDTPPLLSIVGDALRSSIDQLETVSEMHDLACRYRACAPTSTSQASEMWRLVASLPDPTRLQAAVTAASSLGSAHANIRNAFGAMASRHALLTAAYARASAGSALAEVTGVFELAPEAEELAVLIRLADERWRNFQTDGLFLGPANLTLHAGMQNKQVVVQQLGQRVGALEAAYASYNDQRVTLVNTLLGELRNGQQERSLLDRLTIVSQRISDASLELGGLRSREMSERAAWANYHAAFEEMRDSGVFDDDVAANTDALPAIDLSGEDARFSASGQTPAFLAVRNPQNGGPWMTQLNRGQSLRFEVRNDWTPSCALQIKAGPGGQYNHVSGPDAAAYSLTNIDRITGPEGYIVQFTGTHFDVDSSNSDTTYRQAATVDACLKISTGVPGIVSFFIGVDAEAWVQLCASLSLSQSFSEANSNGTDNRSSASFAGGIHLDNTPFPDAPAGALLLVLTTPGSNSVVDVQVVGRQAAFIAPENVDAYLVVNDFSRAASNGKCQSHGDRKIHVEAFKVTSFGAMAEQLSQAMAGSLAEIRAAAPAILAQGQLVAGEEQLLRLHARQRVAQMTGFDVTQLPNGVQEFFETWIAAELVSLQRRAEMYRHERDLRVAQLELASIAHEQQDAADQSRLTRLAPRWLLRRLQTSRLAQDERALLRYLRDYAPPIFELRYPRALRDLLTSPDGSVSAKAQLDLLERMDFAATGDDVAGLLLVFGNKVNDALEGATANAADYGVVRAAVSFPDPNDFSTADEPFPPGCGQFVPCNETASAPATTWHSVEMTRAQLVWAALREHGKATFTVTPEDLYDVHGGIGQLTCYDSAPIIRKMAVYAVTTDANEWGQIEYRPAIEVGAEQTFPTSTGLPAYVKTDADWLFTGVPMLGGVENEALSDLRAHDSAAASGLSPFNTFTVDFANFPIPLDQTKQLVMTFELETRPIATPGVAVPECR